MLETLRAELKAIDPNGCYDDDDREMEGFDALTVEDALALLEILARDE